MASSGLSTSPEFVAVGMVVEVSGVTLLFYSGLKPRMLFNDDDDTNVRF